MTEEDIKEAIEHRDVLLAIRAILSTSSGKLFFKYLFKHFEVSELPEIGLDEQFLRDKLGFLRAGNSIFKLVAEANAEVAGALLAENEKDRYARIYAEANIGSI
jgi:hypothetical protein